MLFLSHLISWHYIDWHYIVKLCRALEFFYVVQLFRTDMSLFAKTVYFNPTKMPLQVHLFTVDKIDILSKFYKSAFGKVK